MTVAVVVKVNDGIVLASDSASTVGEPGPVPGSIMPINIYNHGTKIFRLHNKNVPLGAITWGLGNIGSSSLKILAKDFKRELMEGANALDPDSFTVEDVAQRFKIFMFDQRYEPAYSQAANKPDMGFKVVGYSSGQSLGEVWNMKFGDSGCVGPELEIPTSDPGMAVEGTPSPVRRLVLGFNNEELGPALMSTGMSKQQAISIMTQCAPMLYRRLAHPLMPIQDAIDLAVFLEQTTAQFTRFWQLLDTVGGPIEVATLTKYEGFKWVQRKHFYDYKLNY